MSACSILLPMTLSWQGLRRDFTEGLDFGLEITSLKKNLQGPRVAVGMEQGGKRNLTGNSLFLLTLWIYRGDAFCYLISMLYMNRIEV